MTVETFEEYLKKTDEKTSRTLARLESLRREWTRGDMALATSVTLAENGADTQAPGEFDWCSVPFCWERSRPAAFDAKREEALYLAEVHTRTLKDALTQAALFASEGPNQDIWSIEQWIKMAAISAGILENTLADQFKTKLNQELADGE